MSFSVNTNAGAFAALQNLGTSNKLLDIAQSRINTGLKVSGAKDSAAIYSIAQSMRADISGLNAVKGSLDRAQSETDVALAAAEATSDLLIEMRELAVAGSDAGLDASSRTAMNDKFVELRDQIDSIINNAAFNGRNVIDGSNGITAIVDADGTNTISSAAHDLSLSAMSLDSTNLVGSTVSVVGTPIALAGVSISAGSDAEFRAALVNLQNDNGGTLNGESIDPSTGVTTDNIQPYGPGLPSDEFHAGFVSALGAGAVDDGGSTVDGFAFSQTFGANSTVYLVRNGASSYLTSSNPAAGEDPSSPAASQTALTAIDAAIETVNQTLSNLGAMSQRLAIQQQFTSQLSDGIDVGVGNLVDADMALESANLTAYQTRQQLGLQALSIANQAPQSVLSLFR